MTDSAASLQHLEAVASLGARLSAHGIAVFEHHFDYLEFGSWTIVAGTRRRKLEFAWDGRESCLSIARCVQHSSREQKWDAPEFQTLLADADPLGVLEVEVVKQCGTEPGAAPSDGPPAPLNNSGSSGGPPSVS